MSDLLYVINGVIISDFIIKSLTSPMDLCELISMDFRLHWLKSVCIHIALIYGMKCINIKCSL